MKDIIQKTIKYLTYSLVFLFPLFFLTSTFEWFEFNKFYLLFFFSSLILLLYIFSNFLEKKIRVSFTLIDLLAFIFIAVVFLSSVFSVDSINSFFGSYQRIGNGFLTLFFLYIFYLFIGNSINRKEIITKNGIINSVLLSGVFVTTASYFTLYNLWSKFNIPSIFSRIMSSTSSGSMGILCIYIAFISIILITKILHNLTSNRFSLDIKPKNTHLYVIYLISTLFLLFLINQQIGWVVLGLALLFLIFVGIKNQIYRKNINSLIIPIIIFIFCLLLSFPTVNTFFKSGDVANVTQENNLPYYYSWQIAWKGTTESIKSILLGSGIGTFSYDYSKYRSSEIALNPDFRNIKIMVSGNYFFEILATTGFLGIITYLEIFLLLLLYSLSHIKKKEDGKSEYIIYLLPLILLFISQIFYYQNIVLLFFFWLFLAIAKNKIDKVIFKKEFSFRNLPEADLLANTTLVILLVIVLSFWYVGGKYYIADVNFANAQNTTDLEHKISLTEKAIQLNPNVYLYHINLSVYYWQEFTNDLASQKITDKNILISRLNEILDTSKKAVEVGKNQALAWQTVGEMYQKVSWSLSSLGDNDAIIKKTLETINQAKELDPYNPYIYVTETYVYALAEEFDKAEESINRAISLDENNIFFIGDKIKLLEQKGDQKSALTFAMESFTRTGDINILYEVGRISFELKEYSNAQIVFEKILSVNPNQSNSLYYLSAIAEERGNYSLAIKYLEKIKELNPGEDKIQKKIDSLK